MKKDLMKKSKRILLIVILAAIIVSLVFLYWKGTIHSVRMTVDEDENGIQYRDYGYVYGKQIGVHYSATATADSLTKYYNEFKNSNDEKAKQFLINNANWLVDNMVLKENYAIYYWDFPWPTYDLPSNWRSSLSQGKAITALLKAYEVTNDERYLEASKLLINSFFIEVKDGGTTYKTQNDGWWYEEYAHQEGLKSRVLNGMITTVLVIYNYYNDTKDPEAKYLFDQGIIALKNELPKYDFDDFGNYSYYDLLGNPARAYHEIHIVLLDRLYNISNEEIFLEYSEKWSKCDDTCQFINKVYLIYFGGFKNSNA